jgi:hypothetical protein
MKLKLRVKTLDEVPEALRQFYREQEGGGFIVDADGDPDGWGIDNLAKLRGQLDEAQRKKASLEGKLLKKEDGSLFTREEIEALQSQLTESTKLVGTLKDKDKSTEEKFVERLRGELAPLQAKLTKAESRIEGYRSKVLGSEVDRAVEKVLSGMNPLPEWRDLMRDELRRHIRVEEGEDGNLTTMVINPADGKPRYSSLTGVEGQMSLDEFAKDKCLRERYGKCLAGDGKEGAGPLGTGTPARGGQAKNIVLRHDHSQAEFEAAFAKAKEQGGEVVFQEAPAQT